MLALSANELRKNQAALVRLQQTLMRKFGFGEPYARSVTSEQNLLAVPVKVTGLSHIRYLNTDYLALAVYLIDRYIPSPGTASFYNFFHHANLDAMLTEAFERIPLKYQKSQLQQATVLRYLNMLTVETRTVM